MNKAPKFVSGSLCSDREKGEEMDDAYKERERESRKKPHPDDLRQRGVGAWHT